MVYGILIRLFRIITVKRGAGDGSPLAKSSRPPLKINWSRGGGGKPHGHWDRGATAR